MNGDPCHSHWIRSADVYNLPGCNCENEGAQNKNNRGYKQAPTASNWQWISVDDRHPWHGNHDFNQSLCAAMGLFVAFCYGFNNWTQKTSRLMRLISHSMMKKLSHLKAVDSSTSLAESLLITDRRTSIFVQLVTVICTLLALASNFEDLCFQEGKHLSPNSPLQLNISRLASAGRWGWPKASTTWGGSVVMFGTRGGELVLSWWWISGMPIINGRFSS